MKILTVANRKGGAGKSTCAAHVAAEAAKSGYKTLIIDLDPQKSLEAWWKHRAENDIDLVDADAKSLDEILSNPKIQEYDLCVIDTPGDTSQNAIAGISVADLVLIPCKPTAPDLSAIGRTIGTVENLKKKYAFLITQAIINAKANFQASSALSRFGTVIPALMSLRTSYSTAMGLGVSAATTDQAARQQVEEIWRQIDGLIFDKKTTEKAKVLAK